MVHIQTALPLHDDGTVDIDRWVKQLNLPTADTTIIHNACNLAQIIGEDCLTPYNANCFRQGLETAEILAGLQFDPDSIATAVIYTVYQNTDITLEEITDQLGESIASLINNIDQMSMITKSRHLLDSDQPGQIDNIRKMLLAMVKDVRAIVIKLADRLIIMRAARNQSAAIKKRLAQETFNIFAPLANRLGLHQIKWELEDLSFLYLNKNEYLEIAKNLDERRTDRTELVTQFVSTLKKATEENHIDADIYGRAKHIYSIKRKMQRKDLPIEEIYDIHAIRILVSTVEECYKVLSIAHELFTPIAKEFDDYITTPKPNGYQSIHTAVIGPKGKNFEIQIRTHKMHKEAEMGLAAHWIYKEGRHQQPSYEEKITWLRYLLDWQKELNPNKKMPEEMEKKILEDRVYVFTPAGDIIDLRIGATPLDFAYHIHTEVGHRCRGAKVNQQIVPLTHQLKTGDQIEILTTKKGGPSRDWLIPKRGYLKTSIARAKVLQWFRHQNLETHISQGKTILERELQRLGLENVNLNDIARKLDLKNAETMFAALGSGNMRLMRIINAIPKAELHVPPVHEEEPTTFVKPERPSKRKRNIIISGVGDLLSKLASCCHPIPGDPIIGYITKGEGVTIHHRDCKNIALTDEAHRNRLVQVQWIETQKVYYPVDIEALAYDRPNLLRDITTLLANKKINVTHLNTTINHKLHEARILLTAEIDDLTSLTILLDQLQQIPNVHTVKRVHHG